MLNPKFQTALRGGKDDPGGAYKVFDYHLAGTKWDGSLPTVIPISNSPVSTLYNFGNMLPTFATVAGRSIAPVFSDRLYCFFYCCPGRRFFRSCSCSNCSCCCFRSFCFSSCSCSSFSCSCLRSFRFSSCSCSSFSCSCLRSICFCSCSRSSFSLSSLRSF